jgi:hypothetical protein
MTISLCRSEQLSISTKRRVIVKVQPSNDRSESPGQGIQQASSGPMSTSCSSHPEGHPQDRDLSGHNLVVIDVQVSIHQIGIVLRTRVGPRISG